MFHASIRTHIYAIYGMTRLADEIVDTYKGPDSAELLDALEQEVYAAIARGYSTNPLLEAYQQTANTFGIDADVIRPFFASMRTDLTKTTFTRSEYVRYIYGSAEVVGLMCLKVFVNGDTAAYESRREAAAALGAAYQKINFLRDLAADHKDLGRMYFPGLSYETFNQRDMDSIIKDIKSDFAKAQPAIQQLPAAAKRAVNASYKYYSALLTKLEATPAEVIKVKRIRINNIRKVMMLV